MRNQYSFVAKQIRTTAKVCRNWEDGRQYMHIFFEDPPEDVASIFRKFRRGKHLQMETKAKKYPLIEHHLTRQECQDVIAYVRSFQCAVFGLVG